MKRKIVIIGIIFSLISIGYITAAQQIKINDNVLNRGGFEAQLGLRRNDRPTSFLDGSYNMRGRIRVVRGTFSSSDIEGSFLGTFYGNTFFMKIPVRGSTQTIFGRIRVIDDYSTFSGSWSSRGIDIQGWISGNFITRE